MHKTVRIEIQKGCVQGRKGCLWVHRAANAHTRGIPFRLRLALNRQWVVLTVGVVHNCRRLV